MGTRGRPKISEFVEHCIAFKVMQFAKQKKETHYKAWFRLIKHKEFPKLLQSTYKSQPRSKLTITQAHWVQRLCSDYETQRKFYFKHIRKWVNKRSGIGSLQEWTLSYSKIKGFKK